MTPLPDHTKQANEALRAAAQRTYDIAKEVGKVRNTPLPEPYYGQGRYLSNAGTRDSYTEAQLTAYGAAKEAEGYKRGIDAYRDKLLSGVGEPVIQKYDGALSWHDISKKDYDREQSMLPYSELMRGFEPTFRLVYTTDFQTLVEDTQKLLGEK